MKVLARALINAAAYLDLSGDDGLDADTALQALEEIGYNLRYCNDAEKDALAQVLKEMREAELSREEPRPAMLEFLATFLASFGLEEDDDKPDHPWDDSRRFRLL